MRLALLFLCPLFAFSSQLQVEISAPSALLMNGKTGAILYEKNGYTPSYPASVTKVATALFVLDHKKPDLNQWVTVSENEMRMNPSKPGAYPSYWLEKDGTMMGLIKGESLPLEALLHGLMMVSGNDAANVIAEALSPSIPHFVEELNSYLAKIGCMNTQYKNPHGLHDPEHFTTAFDIALMMKRALDLPKFKEVISKVSYARPKTNRQPKGELIASNALIKQGPRYYPKAIGGKTGFHSNSQSCLAAAAQDGERVLIAVILGSSKTGRYEEAKKLFEAAFEEKLVEKQMVSHQQIFRKGIEGASSELKASLPEDLNIEFYPAEEPECRAFIHWDLKKLPIRKGEKVGSVQIVDSSGESMAQKELIALEEVKGTFIHQFKDKFSWLMGN